MWKSLVFAAGVLVGISSAGSASWSEDISVHNKHYSQHESSVNAARRAAADRLQQSAALVASGSVSSGPCETLCYMSADAGDAETIGQGIVGFTSAGGATSGTSQKYSSSSSRHETSVQNAVAAPIVYPVASTGTRSSFSSSSSSRQHTASAAAQPVLGQLYSTQARDRVHSGNVIATSGIREGTYIQPLVYPVPAPQTHASQSSYERSSSVVTRPATASVVYVPTADTAASNTFNTRSSYVSSSSADQQHLQPVAYSSGTNSDYARRNEFTSQQQQQDLQYRQQYPAKGNTYVLYSKPMPSSVQYYAAPSRSRVEDSSTTSTAYDSSGRVVNLNIVQPALTERLDEQRTQRVQSVHQSVQQPEAIYGTRGHIDQVDGDTLVEDEVETDTGVPVSGGTSSSSHRREHSYVRTGSYTPTVAPIGSNRYSSSSQTSEAQRRQMYHSAPGYVQVVPVAGAGSVASSKYESASEHQRHSSGGYVPVPVQPVSTGAASRHASSSVQEQRSNTYSNPGGYYSAGTGGAGHGSQYSAQSSSSHSNRYSKQGSAGFQHYPIANDELGRRFGASGGSPGGLGADADLHNIMSETESLARVQAQNVHNGAVAGSGTIDTDTRFGGSSADDAGMGTMPGGFQRTKSWSSSSKWASEQRYGDDGKPKTYSMLSTAESEKHNINGKTTGYKAATTTLEDDGKVSTYSLHTT
ncbi:mucin-12 isoform X2 [Anopheles bellator]|uniref:mucin-12 isoform X2 n=1 Tax=Anopheles bellator TaxID=139047 RepID=UPI0026482A03|nr:mucin-12 isoform X2 [Anopheles bellator]